MLQEFSTQALSMQVGQRVFQRASNFYIRCHGAIKTDDVGICNEVNCARGQADGSILVDKYGQCIERLDARTRQADVSVNLSSLSQQVTFF
jgi:hypothetical protein